MKIPWDSPRIMVLWKLLNTFGRIFGSCLFVFCSRTVEIHFLCIELIN